MNNTALSPSSFLLPPSPMFSIIIPVYNVAPYLRACLDSVLAAVKEAEAAREEMEKVGGQLAGKRPVVEIICVDDGSTDGSGEILDEYRAQVESSSCEFESRTREGNDEESAAHLHLFSPPHNPPPHPPSPSRPPLFRVLHQKNAGVSAARNAALDAAAGEWVTFVDADDLVSPNCFRVLFDVVSNRTSLDLIEYRYRAFQYGDETCLWSDIASEDENREVRVSPALCSQLGYNVWCVAMRRSLIAARRFKPYVVGEDILFLYQVAVQARCMVSINKALYGYRNRSGSVIRSKMTARKFLDHLGYHLEIFELLRNCPDKFGRSFVKVCLNRYLEGSMRDLSELKDDRVALLRQVWRAGLELVSECKAASQFQRIRMWAIRAFGIRAIEWLLLDAPMRMKVYFYGRCRKVGL